MPTVIQPSFADLADHTALQHARRSSRRTRARVFLGTFVLLLLALTLPVANAYQILTPIVSPVPVSAGTPLKLSANMLGPLTDVTVSVTVTYGGQKLFVKSYPLGNIGPGQIPFYVPASDVITIPTQPRGQRVEIFIVVLQGKEQYVGEPGGKPFYLISRCPPKPIGAPCVYAPAQHWIRRELTDKKQN